MDRNWFNARRKEDATIFEGTLRDMLELDTPNLPKPEIQKVLTYFQKLISPNKM